MNRNRRDNLNAIHFSGELLPNCAQLLDVAARLCPVPEEVRHWFSRFTSCAGVDDARTVLEHCHLLRQQIQQSRDSIATELQRTRNDAQPLQIIAAWTYTLDTMMQVARAGKTCSWTVEGAENDAPDDSSGGDITLRRV